MKTPALLALALLALAGPVRADYLFTYFTKNGQDGLHLACSTDGYHWKALNDGKSYLQQTIGKSKLMRDPCVARGPDGTYHLVWTAGWTEDDIGYASTKDFITWSPQKELPVMRHEPKVRNTWAPEIVWDDKRRHFLIFWASTIPDRFTETASPEENGYNHRIYCTTTKDFVEFTPTRLFYDPGFNVIDATFLQADQGLYLVIKDETRKPAKKYLQLVAAEDFEGPFKKPSDPISPPGMWTEGPTALKVGDEYLIYFDAYTAKHYGVLSSKDLQHWEDVTAKASFPFEKTDVRMRHGTVIEVPHALIEKLEATPVHVEPLAPASTSGK